MSAWSDNLTLLTCFAHLIHLISLVWLLVSECDDFDWARDSWQLHLHQMREWRRRCSCSSISSSNTRNSCTFFLPLYLFSMWNEDTLANAMSSCLSSCTSVQRKRAVEREKINSCLLKWSHKRTLNWYDVFHHPQVLFLQNHHSIVDVSLFYSLCFSQPLLCFFSSLSLSLPLSIIKFNGQINVRFRSPPLTDGQQVTAIFFFLAFFLFILLRKHVKVLHI